MTWAIFALALAILISWIVTAREREKEFCLERSEWREERQQLLDRIQAPTFAEYTNKVIKEKKLDQKEEEPKPPEYIS